MGKIKRFICLVFVALLMGDVLSYIKLYIENDNVLFHRFTVFSTQFSNHLVVFNLSLIYFIGVSIVYFCFNFFKKER